MSAKKNPTDVLLHQCLAEMRALEIKSTDLRNQVDVLCNKIELTDTAALADAYGYCVDLIDPHVVSVNGMNTITQDSLCSSVCESLDYLIKFWLANKDKPGIDLVLD